MTFIPYGDLQIVAPAYVLPHPEDESIIDRNEPQSVMNLIGLQTPQHPDSDTCWQVGETQ